MITVVAYFVLVNPPAELADSSWQLEVPLLSVEYDHGVFLLLQDTLDLPTVRDLITPGPSLTQLSVERVSDKKRLKSGANHPYRVLDHSSLRELATTIATQLLQGLDEVLPAKQISTPRVLISLNSLWGPAITRVPDSQRFELALHDVEVRGPAAVESEA